MAKWPPDPVCLLQHNSRYTVGHYIWAIATSTKPILANPALAKPILANALAQIWLAKVVLAEIGLAEVAVNPMSRLQKFKRVNKIR